MGEKGGQPLAPAPTTSGGVGDIAPTPTQGSFGLSSLGSGGKNYGIVGFGGKPEQPYMTGQSLGQRFNAQNDPTMGLDKLDSAYADQKGAKDAVKYKLISMASKGADDLVSFKNLSMASKGADDLVSFKNFGFSPEGMPGKGQPAWQKGYGVGDIYNPLMQNEMKRRQMEAVQRFNQGRSV